MARENKPGSPKRAGKSGGPVGKPKAKASTSYSPAPMSAAAKAKAKAAGKATAAKTKPKSKSLVSKVVGRAKTVAREVRDIPTALGTIAATRTMPKGDAARFAKKDLKMQLKEVGRAVVSGKKGTEAAKEGSATNWKNRTGAGSPDLYVSKPKTRRK